MRRHVAMRGATLLLGGAPRDEPWRRSPARSKGRLDVCGGQAHILQDSLCHVGPGDTRTFHEALERDRGMFPTKVQMPNPLALDPFERRLPRAIRCITPQ